MSQGYTRLTIDPHRCITAGLRLTTVTNLLTTGPVTVRRLPNANTGPKCPIQKFASPPFSPRAVRCSLLQRAQRRTFAVSLFPVSTLGDTLPQLPSWSKTFEAPFLPVGRRSFTTGADNGKSSSVSALTCDTNGVPRYDAYRPLPGTGASGSPPDPDAAAVSVPDISPALPTICWWPTPDTATITDPAMAQPATDPFLRGLHEVASAAGQAVGGADVSKTAPAVDVTRHNFEAMLPVVKRYLHACDFYAFDCEMTGLFMEGQTENWLDDMQDRYLRTAAAAQNFVINQFGLSCFKRQKESGPNGEKQYLAATFNFYLFPRQPEGGNGQSRRFLCDAGSLAFLSAQGFDFNRCIADGVPFIPVRQRDMQLRKLDQHNGNGEDFDGRSNVVLEKQEDKEFVQGLLTQVREWLASNPTEPLDLAPVNRYLRLLSYQALARPENFGGPPGRCPGWHPGFHVRKVSDERNFTCLRLVPCPDAATAAALEATDRQERRRQVVDAAGFASVWEAMRDCGRPAVGHNCMFDVAYGTAQFGDGRLPATWEGFKAAVASWYRGGLYDTKHICRQLPDLLGSDTSLGVMYRALMSPGEGAPALPARMAVSHAPGFEKYVAVAAGQLAHEAGYDAFMTGSVFVALEAVMEQRNGASPSASPYASIIPYLWRLNVTRSDMPHTMLCPAVPGDPNTRDPVPERPLVVYLGTLSDGVRAGDIHRGCEEVGVGKVRITFLPGNNALLELSTAEAVVKAMSGALVGKGLCSEVLRYSEYHARKESMLAAGTWPLPGYSPRGAYRYGARATPAVAAATPELSARPAKRSRVEMEEPAATRAPMRQESRSCTIM